ncbi:MAG: DUF4833 domain-containing protein [Phyllobacteriaceae bacterium]|nr:DUF4833 domain-containing protein [Phyllobacteriaceae bacterium]
MTPFPTSPSSISPCPAPTRRRVLGLAAAAIATATPAAALPSIVLPRMRSEFSTFAELPVVRPDAVPKDEGVLFYVQQSINANVIVYALHRTPAGTLDPTRPVDVFWRRFATKGHRRELSFFERMFAFGVACDAEGPGRWAVRLVSLPGREGRLEPGPDGAPRLLMEVDHRPMRPVYVYADVADDGFIPTLRHVDLFAVADGAKGYVRERVVFG